MRVEFHVVWIMFSDDLICDFSDCFLWPIERCTIIATNNLRNDVPCINAPAKRLKSNLLRDCEWFPSELHEVSLKWIKLRNVSRVSYQLVHTSVRKSQHRWTWVDNWMLINLSKVSVLFVANFQALI